MIEIVVEEFEQGTWIADVKDVEPIDGSFDLAGETWSGTVLHSREENGVYLARILGGKNGLSKQVRDRYYERATQYADVIRAIATEAGESVGSVDAGQVQTYMRIAGSAGNALDKFCETYGLQWWISRSGILQVQRSRPSGPAALGVRVESGPDGFVIVRNPENVQIGGTFENNPIRHIRWFQTGDLFEVVLYPTPFDEVAKALALDYGRLHLARVQAQKPDGTLDVIVAARFNVTKVPMLSGVPTARIDMSAGDIVVLGFYGGDPRAPFAIATMQASGPHTGGKAVARVDDAVDCGKLAAQGVAPGNPIAFVYTPPGGIALPPSTTITLQGRISEGNPRVRL